MSVKEAMSSRGRPKRKLCTLKECRTWSARFPTQTNKLTHQTCYTPRLPSPLHASGSFSPYQVKELEQILRRRNPNSLPALIYAAATADSQCDVDVAKTPPTSRTNALLERRIQRLEAELESHDEEAKRSLRAMEQQFHRIKVQLKSVLGTDRIMVVLTSTDKFQIKGVRSESTSG